MRNKLSQTQRMALFWAGGLAPAAEHLPRQLADLAGTGSWLAPLLAALPLLLLLRLAAHFLLGDEESLEDAVKRQLLLPGAGKHRPQRRLYLLPVCHPQGNERLSGIRRFRRTDGQPFQP